MRTLLPALALLATSAQTAPKPAPGLIRVRLDTSAGPITVAVDQKHAPVTAGNFLAYVDDGRFDGTQFFRAARAKTQPGKGFIEGGINGDVRRTLEPIRLEPTSRTGVRHVDGAISMARTGDPDSAQGDFSLYVGAAPAMDARPGNPGYAAFGRVVAGMDTVKRILAMPSGGGEGMTKGQMLLRPVTIMRAVRLDGPPHPTGGAKPWLINFRH